jgi:hypothetical protein
MFLTLLLLAIFIACVGFLFTEGMWGNALRLINVVTAALLATNFFEPVAAWMEGLGDWFASLTYVWDFLALWGLFGIFVVLFSLATDMLSKVRVRFLTIVNRIGSAFFAAWIGWVMICFTMMTLHTAPLARAPFGGGFQPEKRMFFGLAPDRLWLVFVQNVSRGQFCRTATKEDFKQEPRWKEDQTRTFDPGSEFMPKYATRRANLEAHMKKPTTKSIRVLPKDLPK